MAGSGVPEVWLRGPLAGFEPVLMPVAQIDQALEQLRHTAAERLGDTREVGRARLPTTVLGLLFHGAEHTSRHAGQLITTLKVMRAGGRESAPASP